MVEKYEIMGNQLSKQRLHYIDIAKGLLIFTVIVGHISDWSSQNGVTNELFVNVSKINFTFTSFFMAAFFAITGYCTNFNKAYKQYLWSDIKSLIVPSVTLVVLAMGINYLLTGILDTSGIRPHHLIRFISSHWFLLALFWAKQIHYFVRRIKNKYIILFLYIIFSFLGCLLNNVVKDYYWMQHGLDFVLFLFIGELMKSYDFKFDRFVWCVIPYVIYVGIAYLLFPKIPHIAAGVDLELWQLPLFYIGAITGTFMIMYISKKLNTNRFLEYLGRQSLIVYCLHFTFIGIFCRTFKCSLNSMNMNESVLALIIFLAFVIGMCLLCAWLLNKKYLKWMIGK